MTRRKKEYSRFAIAADSIGITHMVVGTLAILLGEVTQLFSKFDADHGGVAFVLGYLDAPVYYLIAPFVPLTEGDRTYMILVGLAVCVLASIVYAAISYILLRFAVSLFKSGA